LKIVEKRNIQDHWKHFADYQSIQIVVNENQVFILNREGQKLANFPKGNDIVVIGSLLIIVKEKSILKINLNQFE